jgi:hypothetical protein
MRRKSASTRGQARAGARRRLVQLLPQSGQAVGGVVVRVVARQQLLARLGEEHHHQAHHDADGGAVDVGRIDVGTVPLQHVAVRLDEQLYRLAHALAKDGRQLRLSLAAVEDRLEQDRRGAALLRRPERGLEQRPQRRDLRRERPLLEPEIDVPLAPGVEVEAGEDEPPLPAVGEHGEPLGAGAQPLQRLARRPRAAADAQPRLGVDEHGERGAEVAAPQVPRLDDVAADSVTAPLGADRGPAVPRPDTRGEPADLLEHERGEVSGLERAVLDLGHLPPQLVLEMGSKRRRLVRRDGPQPCGIQEEAAVAEAVPAEEVCRAARHHTAAPSAGSRISTATGKTCACPDMAWRLGSRYLRMRSRSRSSCARISS